MTRYELGKPEKDEYDPYYDSYVQRVDTDDVLEALTSHRADVLELLDGLSEERALFRYASGKWSLKEVFGHMLDTERVFAYRALCIARGETQPLPGFDQDDYVTRGAFDERPIESLEAEYLAVRSGSLTLFEDLMPDAWMARGIANDVEISVRAIAFILAGHELHHLEILRQRYLASG